MRAALLTALLAGSPAWGAEPQAEPATDVRAQLDAGAWSTVAADAAAILDDPSQSAAHGAAWSQLGAALHRGGYPYAGLTAWGEALGRDTHAVGPWYPTLLEGADQLHEDVWIGGLVGADFSVPMDADTRARVALLAARSQFADGSWGGALGLLPLVPSDGPLGLEATVLQGVLLSQQSRYSEALVPLLTAYERARTERAGDPRYVSTVALNVARVFYASGNYARAMEYYDKVGRGDPAWVEALFERAWAHFRVEDMQGTLAVLHTHQSPFFEDWYLPEAWMLRAQALYLMCKFPDTSRTIDRFQELHTPLRDALDDATPDLDAASTWDDVLTFLDGGEPALPAPILRRTTWDGRIARAREALAQATTELGTLKANRASWARHAATALQARHDARVREEGGRILDRALQAQAEIDEMLTGLELTRVDLLSFEADLYSRAAATGEVLEMGDRIGKLRKLRRKGKRVWPFQGEYWADELGWYRIDDRPDCPTDLQRGD